MEIDIKFLEVANGKCPFIEWETNLDKSVRGAVRIRINRLRLGNLGDCKSIRGASGLFEIRIHLGAGYRIYFGKIKDCLIIILCGGNKGSQERDIPKKIQESGI